MSKFTASNDVEIRVERDFSGDIYLTGKAGGCIVATGNMDGIGALREFFQHERDQELGRWRDPEYPHIFVRQFGDSPNIVGVVKDNEEGLAYGQFRRGDYPSLDPMGIVASRYFAAHPESKPWHDAKPGEAWVISYGGEEHAVISDGAYFLWQGGSEQEITDSRITGGRRIWPEGSNDS